MDFQTTGALSSTCGYTQIVLNGSTSPITGLIDLVTQQIYGQSGYIAATYEILATDRYNLSTISGQTFRSVYSYLYPGQTNNFSLVRAFKVFGANQFDFFTYPKQIDEFAQSPSPVTNSTYAIQYSLPKPLWNLGPTEFSGTSGTGFSPTYMNLATAFLRDDGLIGPASFATLILTHSYTNLFFRMPTLQIFGLSNLTFSNFAIDGVMVWFGNNEDPTSRFNQYAVGLGALNATYVLVSGQSYTVDERVPEDYVGTFLFGPDGNSQFSPQNPRTIEVYANALFSAGFLQFPDTVWPSRLGEFEKHDLEAFFDFRANDGDIITCLKTYFTQLIIFKTNSIGCLTGTDPSTYTLSEMTTEYGCLSNNAACVWEQKLWFLDKSGVCEYNGANTRCVSDRIEYIFKEMNIPAAKNVASMIHVKERNEVWCSFPTGTNTTCDKIAIYDYLSDAWTIRTIRSGTSLNLLRGVSNQAFYFGDASGMIFKYNASLTTDNGSAFTCLIQTRFCHDMGHSVEKMFRRLYIDAVVPSGQTYNIGVNFYANQGTTPVLQTTMSISEYQKRLDFGISGSDLSIEFVYSDGNFLKLNGYTLEYRFQRSVSGQG